MKAQQEEGLLEIFRTDFNGRRLINNEAVRRMIIDLNLGEEDQLGAKWFASALKNPTVASRFKDSWTRPVTRDEQKLIDESRRNTFHEVMLELGLSESEGNWSIFPKDLLDNAYTAKEAITSGAVRGLMQATSAEIQEREAIRNDQENLRLLNSSVHDLKEEVHAGAVQRQQEFKQKEADRVLDIKRQFQDGRYEPLPSHWRGEVLDATFIKKAKPELIRLLRQRFGSYQLDLRLRGEAA